jgi:hypothetical protein
MSLDIQRLKHAAAARDNPAGRAYEVKVAYYQGFSLILGCIGVVLAFPPLIYLAAAGVLLTGFMAAIVKWFWVIAETVTISIATALLVAATYAVQVYYYDYPSADVVNYFKLNWYEFIAAAIVVRGIIGDLFAYPGCLDQLREHLDRTS